MSTYDTLTPELKAEIEKAISLINIKDIKELSYGEDLELTDEVCLSHYCEDEVIVLNLTKEWVEVYQVLYNGDAYILEAI
tara:strand:+ start:301 stop:540 length:240 start_codon:yes stop_codon:yes gene_type:complete